MGLRRRHASFDGKPVGVLGADLAADGARSRIAHIYPSSDEQRSPLDDAGVTTGSFLVAIDGHALTSAESVEALLEGTPGKEVTVTIATDDGRVSDVKVKPLGNDMPLRYAEWVAANRARVLRATGGRCGYIHVPNTGRDGIAAFAKQFVAQIDKEALIVDVRWNSGGLFPASMIEHLRRITLAHEASRHGNDLRVPGLAMEGPKVLLANQNTISGGDSFAIYFRNAAIGPIIGTRTAGATVGNVGMPSLIDGGEAAVAALAYWEPAGKGTSAAGLSKTAASFLTSRSATSTTGPPPKPIRNWRKRSTSSAKSCATERRVRCGPLTAARYHERYERSRRNSVGVVPMLDLKTRQRCAWSAKPAAKAMSAIDREVAISSRQACWMRSMRT